nr:heparan-alpha-glucosaminide N-acetyltransferase-like [Ipomoea batatas]
MDMNFFCFFNLTQAQHISYQDHCNVRGCLDPPCNAVGFIDRLILGESHLYQRAVYKRTKVGQLFSLGLLLLCWNLKLLQFYHIIFANPVYFSRNAVSIPLIMQSLMAAITCLVGLHYGHILIQVKGHKQRIIFWSIFSFPLLIVGLVLVVVGNVACISHAFISIFNFQPRGPLLYGI